MGINLEIANRIAKLIRIAIIEQLFQMKKLIDNATKAPNVNFI
jgi:hypothetical protein